jgi:hypothetical protein
MTLVMAATAFAADLKVDADLVAGSQANESVTISSQGGADSTIVKVWINGGGQITYPVAFAEDGVTGIVTGATSGSIPAKDYGNGVNSTVSLDVPCEVGTHTGTIRFGGTPTTGTLENSTSTVTINATVAAGATCFSNGGGNAAPVADAGGPYIGTEGSNVSISGALSSDEDGDTLNYKWTYTVDSADAGTACSFADDQAAVTAVSCTDDGTFTLWLEVSDGSLSDTADASLTLTNANPAFTTGNTAFASTSVSCASRTVTVNFAFTDAGTNDTHTGSIDFGDGSGSRALTATELANGSASHMYNSGGPYTATVTIADDDAGSTGATSTTNTLTVLYNTSGILQPINADGTSLFKISQTIPVKAVFTDCEGSLPATNPTVHLSKISNGLNGDEVVESLVSSSAADTGNQMRYSTEGEQYIFNLSTKKSQFNGGKDLTEGRYRLTVKIDGITQFSVEFGLRK